MKMTKDIVPDDFTITLAMVDFLPVAFFCGSMILISQLFHSNLFLIGALLCFWAGAAKVLWKIIVVVRRKNIWWMFLQMRIAMPLGFLMMLTSVIMNRKEILWPVVWAKVSAMPACLCFIAGIVGMVLMGMFAAKLDSSDVQANWIEQLTNGVAQGLIFLGIWMAM